MDRFSVTQAIQPNTNDGQSPTYLQSGALWGTRPSSTASSRMRIGARLRGASSVEAVRGRAPTGAR